MAHNKLSDEEMHADLFYIDKSTEPTNISSLNPQSG